MDFWFESDNFEENYIDSPLITFFIDQKEKQSIPVQLNGISLEKRKKGFEKDISNKFHPKSKDITLRRMNFLEDLLKLSDSDLKVRFSVNFADE